MISNNSQSQTTNIPDPNFEQALIDLGYDNGIPNGYILTDSIDKITFLDVESKNISNLTGIEDFVSLKDLRCGNNPLSSINLTNNKKLWQFYCNNTQIDSMDFSSNDSLTFLDINNNQLQFIAFPTSNKIYFIECQNNQLTTLNLQSCISLETLLCHNNMLSYLDLNNNNMLKSLVCDRNNMNSLNLTTLPLLEDLSCISNQLTSLDLSSNSNLEFFKCDSNQIECLNIANGNNSLLYIFSAVDNPFICVEVDDTAYSSSNWSSQVSNYTFNSCSYTNCNSLTGTENITLKSKYLIFPNPINQGNSVNISSKPTALFSISGKTEEIIYHNGKLQTNLLNSGIYFLQYKSTTQKLIIK